MKFIHNLVMSVEWYDKQSLKRLSHIISKSEDRILFLVDDSEKVDDVSKMPDYIQKDYVTYNSRDITEENVNMLIRKLEWWCGFGDDESSGRMPSSEKYEEYMGKIQILKNIKRDIKIKKLLS